MNLWYDTKDYHFGEIKDLDMKGRRVSGYLSSFDNIDRDGDVIIKGAFKKTLQERKSEIRFLNQHEWKEPHGFFEELEEDSYGLYFVSKALTDTTYSSDALKLYDAGIIDQHSIGFETVKKENREGVRYLTELKLWEGSNVTMAANPLARFRGLKSLNPKDAKKEVQGKLNTFLKAFRTGTFTDDTFDLLQIAIKQLMTQSAQLAVEEYKSHSEPKIVTLEPIDDKLKVLQEFNNTF